LIVVIVVLYIGWDVIIRRGGFKALMRILYQNIALFAMRYKNMRGFKYLNYYILNKRV